jgi:drug/metabolite transporter (DMT)-like permease
MLLAWTILHERIPFMASIGSALTIGGVCGVVYFTSLSNRVVAANEVAPES